MVETYVNIIKSHEDVYSEFINNDNFDEARDYSELKSALHVIGKKYMSPMLRRHYDVFLTQAPSVKECLSNTVAFLDNMLFNKVLTVKDFTGMCNKDIFTYTLKRLILNRKYLVGCSKCSLLEEVLDDVKKDKITVPDVTFITNKYK